MKKNQENEPECCPPFETEKWDEKHFTWSNKLFVKDHVFTFLFMPVNFGSVMRRLDSKIRNAEASIPDFVCLSDHTSKWNMDLYLAVGKKIPDVENTTLSGNFYSKVYEGPFQDTGKWTKDFEAHAKEKGFNIKKTYMWYTTCPKCVKKYGKNYVVILAQLDSN